MKIKPRWYQQEAHDLTMAWIKKCFDPCLIEAPTGAGKSIIVAMLAHTLNKASGKKILCLAPSKELVQQNREKYLLTGEPASMFSASAGAKETRHSVVFGSPLTVAKSIDRFGSQYAAVIIDEAHGITPTIIEIVNKMREKNPKLRIIGLSATPYRLGTGYIYANHYAHGAVSEEQAIDPFFSMLVYSIDARMLIAEGFLSQPVFKTTEECYDTSGLTLNRMGLFDAATVDKAFVGQGRKTSVIVNDIIERSRDKKGVMIFAATIQHANEIMDSLPKELSALVTGKNTKQEREQAIRDFKKKRIKYLVNVAVLTTGFDASHVDHVAIMRATESVGLLQQIIGRGLRVEPGKTECLISDYAENIERHCPDGDVFSPEIKARRKLESTPISVCCPSCGYENEFARRPNPDEFEIDSEGYFIDLAGSRILADEDKPLPAHYGRRCKGWSIVAGRMEQCAHKWSFKLCECGAENDIAARYCTTCKSEIIDPNTRLKIEAIKIANDPYRIRTADVQMWNISRHKGKDGKPDSLMVEYMIECAPSSLRDWYHPQSDSAWLLSKWNKFCLAVFGEQGLTLEQAIERKYDAMQPSKVMYQKRKNSKYFEVVGFDFDKAESRTIEEVAS